MKFQDKFYDIIDHNKCPSSEKSAEKYILRSSYFHHSEPRYADTETTWSWDSHCVSVNNIYRLVFAFNSDKVINIFYQYNMILPDDLYPRVG